MAERSKAHAWNACMREIVSRVRIPLSPPSRLQRANSDALAGVGIATYLNGTGKYKKFKGLKCNYAVKYMDDSTNFYRHKCSL